MKKVMLSSLMLTVSLVAFAQDSEEEVPATRVFPDIKKHELGIMTQSGGVEDGVNLLGVQYKVWKDEHRAFRFIAAYGNYNTFNSSIVSLASDSLTEVHSLTKVNMPVIGMGLEMQRNFWRKVYFSAAVDIWGGYGGGSVDTFIHTRQRSNSGGPTITYGSPFIPQDVRMTYVAIAPSIGARIQGKRVTVGLDIMPLQLSYRNLNYEKGTSTGIVDFNAGLYLQRISVSYRL
jgi:hypothetical protein